MTIRSVLRAWYLGDHTSDVAGLIDENGQPIAISLDELNAVKITVGQFTSALKAVSTCN